MRGSTSTLASLCGAAAASFLVLHDASANELCVVPVHGREVTEASRRACIDGARLVGDGTGGAETYERESIVFAEHADDGFVYCEFVPYEMRLKPRGKSKKFWCHRTDAVGRYYNDRSQLAPPGARISDEGVLTDAAGAAYRHEDGSVQRPAELKVKYTDGGNRGREVFTEVAVSRFLRLLGFHADLVIPARVWCRGCSEDPFRDVRTEADNRPRAGASYFPLASIEIKRSRAIETEPDEGWDWQEVYETAAWDEETRVQFEAYVLALNMVHFHNGISKQNTVGCEEGRWDSATGVCERPVLFLDDLGSTFGGGRSRGELGRFRENTVFVDLESCELRSDLAGFSEVSEEGRRFLVDRIANFDEAAARSLFRAAGFNRENTDASPEEWAEAFMARVDEVRTATCTARARLAGAAS